MSTQQNTRILTGNALSTVILAKWTCSLTDVAGVDVISQPNKLEGGQRLHEHCNTSIATRFQGDILANSLQSASATEGQSVRHTTSTMYLQLHKRENYAATYDRRCTSPCNLKLPPAAPENSAAFRNYQSCTQINYKSLLAAPDKMNE